MKNGMKRSVVILWIMSVLIVPMPALADETMNLLEKGSREIGLGTGYGWSIESNRHIESVPLNLRWGCVLTDPKGSSFFKGNWELLVESSVSYLFHNQGKYGIGVAGLIRYNFLAGKCIVPFVQAGVGVWHTNLKMHGFPNDFNFCSQGGAGIQYFINRKMAILGEYRIQHLSNASLYENNAGLNLSNFWIGYAYYY